MRLLKQSGRGVALKDISSSRKNYFDHLRITAAFAVLVSHSFPICGTPKENFFYSLTKLGYYSVAVFFFLSGFLICKSWLSCKSLPEFAIARAFRIFPALFMALLLTVFVLGPLVTVVPHAEYFRSRVTSAYLIWNGTLIKTRFALPGVFLETPFPKVVNGSLWTLPFEMWCYIATAISGIAGLLDRRLLCFGITAVLQLLFLSKTLGIIAIEHEMLSRAIDVSSQFASGATAFILRDHITLRTDAMLTMMLAVLAGILLPQSMQHVLWHLAVPYLTLCVGFLPGEMASRFPISCDLSYGMYIYSFPLQQLGVFLFPGMLWWQNILFATPPTMLLAHASWTLVEKTSLEYAKKLRKRLRAKSTAASPNLNIESQS